MGHAPGMWEYGVEKGEWGMENGVQNNFYVLAAIHIKLP